MFKTKTAMLGRLCIKNVINSRNYLKILGLISLFSNFPQILFFVLLFRLQPAPLTYQIILVCTMWITDEPIPPQSVIFNNHLSYSIYSDWNMTSEVYSSS